MSETNVCSYADGIKPSVCFRNRDVNSSVETFVSETFESEQLVSSFHSIMHNLINKVY